MSDWEDDAPISFYFYPFTLVNSEIQNSDLELTSELIKKASILKNNSINFSNILTREDANLKEISFKLENQTISLSKASKQIKSLTSSSWTTTFLIWGSVLVVLLTFVGTFVFMRFFKKS